MRNGFSCTEEHPDAWWVTAHLAVPAQHDLFSYEKFSPWGNLPAAQVYEPVSVSLSHPLCSALLCSGAMHYTCTAVFRCSHCNLQAARASLACTWRASWWRPATA